LAAAYNLRHTDLDMTILEARDRIGGRTLSIRTKDGAVYSGEQTARKILADAGNHSGQ
jgi:monoamine oxidase